MVRKYDVSSSARNHSSGWIRGNLIFAVSRVAPKLVWMRVRVSGRGVPAGRCSTLVGGVGPQTARGAGPRSGSPDEGRHAAGFPPRAGRSNFVARPWPPAAGYCRYGCSLWPQSATWVAVPAGPIRVGRPGDRPAPTVHGGAGPHSPPTVCCRSSESKYCPTAGQAS